MLNKNALKNHFTLNQTDLKDEIDFLLACAQADAAERDIERIIHIASQLERLPRKQKIEHWQALQLLARRHGILPLVYEALKRHVPAIEIVAPEHSDDAASSRTFSYLEHFRAINTQLAKRNLLMTAELFRVMKLLDKNQLLALTFKGPILSQILYDNIATRQYGDLDILVDESDAYRTGVLLSENGYHPAFSLNTLTNRTCMNATHDLRFYHNANGITIELHWKLFNEKIGKQLSFREIYDNKQILPINARALPTLSNELLLVYLCLHGSKHAWERLEWICDIDRLIRNVDAIDWQKINWLAQTMETEATLALGLALAQSLFNTPLPETIERQTKNDHCKMLLDKTMLLLHEGMILDEGYSKYRAIHLFQMALLKTRTQKFLFLIKTYFGISRNDCHTFLLPESLKFIYLLIKPFRVALKYLQYGK